MQFRHMHDPLVAVCALREHGGLLCNGGVTAGATACESIDTGMYDALCGCRLPCRHGRSRSGRQCATFEQHQTSGRNLSVMGTRWIQSVCLAARTARSAIITAPRPWQGGDQPVKPASMRPTLAVSVPCDDRIGCRRRRHRRGAAWRVRRKRQQSRERSVELRQRRSSFASCGPQQSRGVHQRRVARIAQWQTRIRTLYPANETQSNTQAGDAKWRR